LKIVLASILCLCLASQVAFGVSEGDQEWINLVTVAAGFMVQDMEDITAASEAFDFDALSDGFAALYGHATEAKKLNDECSVSYAFRTSKQEFGYALDDFANAGLYGYMGVDEMDADKITLASQYITSGSGHLTRAANALPQ